MAILGSSDNTVQVLISTQANNQGIDQTKQGLQNLDEQGQSSGKNAIDWGQQFEKAGLVAAGGLAAVTKVASDAISAYENNERALGQLDAVLRSTAGASGVTKQSAVDLSTSLEKQDDVSHNAILSGEDMLLTFTKIGKEQFPQATQAVVDWATAMNGGAIPNADQLRNTAMSLGIALQDPDKGLGRLHRVGVDTSELTKEFSKNMSVADKQRLILQELGKEFGGSASSQAQTFQGKLNRVNLEFEDMKEKVGESIANALGPLLDWFDKMAPSIEKVVTELANNQTVIIAVAGAIAGLFLATIIAAVIAIGWIPLAIAAAFAVVGALVAIIISKWKEWHGVIETIGVVLFPIPALFVWLAGQIIGHFSTISGFVSGVWHGIVSTASWVVGSVGGIFGSIYGAIVGPFQAVYNAVSGLLGGIRNMISGGVGSITSGLHNLHIPGFASGVRNFSGGLALVGEAGPELVSLPSGSNVYNNSQTQNMLGSSSASTTINGNIVLGDSSAVESFFAKIDRDNILARKGLTTTKGFA